MPGAKWNVDIIGSSLKVTWNANTALRSLSVKRDAHKMFAAQDVLVLGYLISFNSICHFDLFSRAYLVLETLNSSLSVPK